MNPARPMENSRISDANLVRNFCLTRSCNLIQVTRRKGEYTRYRPHPPNFLPVALLFKKGAKNGVEDVGIVSPILIYLRAKLIFGRKFPIIVKCKSAIHLGWVFLAKTPATASIPLLLFFMSHAIVLGEEAASLKPGISEND